MSGGDSEDDGTDDFRYLTNTMPVDDDTYLLEDAFETQLVNLAGETQVVDLGGETQVLDDLDCMKDMPIEFLNEFYNEDAAVSKCEGAINTQAFCETQELSQDDSEKIDGSDSVGLESTVDDHPARQDGPSLSGCLLESGLKNDLECLQNEYNEDGEELRNSNKCKVASAAVRKLFKDDEVGQSGAEINRPDDNIDMPDVLASENCLAGLSYANSQEPGELSQAHALEVVDKFLDLNAMDIDEGFGKIVQNVERPKVVSGAKGSRDLAKSSILKSADQECGIFDWDDTREDDGGGEFFLRKKELFFDGPKQRFLTEPRKPRCSNLKSVKAVKSNGDEKEQKCTKNRSGHSVYSDSGLMLHKLRAKGKPLYCGEEVIRKNLMKDLNEQLNVETGLKLVEKDTNKDVQDMKDIGPDTQIAVEAMETLCFEVNLTDGNGNDPDKGAHSTAKATKKNQLSNCPARSEECLTRKRPYHTSVGVVTRQAKQIKRTPIRASDKSSLSPKQSKKIRKRNDTVLQEAEQRGPTDVTVSAYHGTKSTGQRSEKMRHLEDHLGFSVPVAHRTRKCTELHRSKAADTCDAREEKKDLLSARVLKKRTAAKDKNAEIVSIENGRKVGSNGSSASNIGAMDNLQEKRSRQENLAGHQAGTQYNGRLTRSRKVAASISLDPSRSNNSSTCNGPALTSLDIQSGKIPLHQTVNNGSSMDAAAQRDSDQAKVGTGTSKQHDEKSDAEKSSDAAEANDRLEASPPATCRTPINNVSPICMGDEYHKQSCRKNLSRLSLITEINNLVSGSPGSYGGMKESRKRKDITNIRVLFSQHLDEDVIKQQKKILTRLGGAVASFMSDATHFVADEFVRTRNMLEAIASGKPVVTHLWLESCGQASCLIDEKNYILRDSRKEKEFGFSLPVSLSRACQHPLLQGQKVLVTPNTKPGKDILANLVKAVHGLAVERLGRSVLKAEKLPDDLLILSCEEDYDVCVPFLEKGGAVYSSELLLNGIVKQKLEYERHRLFDDHVKKTRSTIWMKKKNRYLPVQNVNKEIAMPIHLV
ncbi:hypothetical protein DH2020_020016 [Rehmannia glutinosa]|uniref:BRCT domain-containing protein n=1 Tax=Rehmannia glutinosa TaxID=99300 RepID=A0ABR0WF28_REHGL